ncbi:ATP-dependent DNA helicase RecG [Nocardioides scoriae]|uniref:ATP-dependent DNA helicase RecG n=1 Tax=Nocardioides scoriae TaxID=642780 RepID=A0A1H1YDG1_9ACTN|nr:ATP-dependent DNA helicase RecG [Nocardioides scoriae]SDT19452.1 ATP-dependent DNA helicase RecG [Nocardioides scoriae]
MAGQGERPAARTGGSGDGVVIRWDSPVGTVAGKDAPKLVKAGIETVGDLIGTYPRNHVAKGSLSELDQLVEGDVLSLVGQVVSSRQFTYQDKRTRRTAYRLEVRVRAEEGSLLLTYFDKHEGTASWRLHTELPVGRVGVFSGRLRWFRDEWQLTNPASRLYADGDDAVDTMPDLIPIYSSIGGITTWQLEEAVELALTLVDRVPEVLPAEVREAEDLVGAAQAVRWVHRPDTWAQKTAAEKRLKHDEAFVAQAVLARRRLAVERTVANPRPGRPGGLLDAFDDRLPFALTAGQQRVGEEIADELGRGHPMQRLLQGEVGSGKTVVALRAMLQVVDSEGQAALLAPTEVLAQQHHRSVTAMLGDLAQGGLLGGADQATRVALLTGSSSAAARRSALADAAGGEAGIVIGTHALLEDRVQFADLGLVVVDEQHRFGVEQRAALGAKAGVPPHVLVMTATPIPRTVAMTVFGDLDTSVLAELPAGRGEVQTTVVPVKARASWLDRAWERVREEVAAGHQAYVVASRIDPGGGEEAATGDEPAAGEGEAPRVLFAVEELAPELAAGALAGLRLEVLHGRMLPEEKDRVMQAFSRGEVDVLVSTTVIEVGVDVPNSTVMVILDADRFGVSQLHQLRGRIGRGGHAGLCLLVTGADPVGPSMERLLAVAGTRDGFELSRIDMEQRREGNVLGTQQSGGRAGGFRLLSVLRDEQVIARARTAAFVHLRRDPSLSEAGNADLADAVRRLEDSAQADFLEKT